MRVKDESKRVAIYSAAMEVINRYGLENTSMAKIAKVANVSSSTIYVYFKNKDDMLNKLYLMAKQESSTAALKNYSEDMPLKEAFKLFFINSYHYMINNPVQFSFTEQFYNSPSISPSTKEEGMSYYRPVLHLLNSVVKEGSNNDSPDLFLAFMYSPMLYLMKQHHAGEVNFSKEMVEQLFEMVWKGMTE